MKMPLLKLSVDNLSHVAEIISRKLSQLSSVSCVSFYKQIINKQRSKALNMANNAANLLMNIIQQVIARNHGHFASVINCQRHLFSKWRTKTIAVRENVSTTIS